MLRRFINKKPILNFFSFKSLKKTLKIMLLKKQSKNFLIKISQKKYLLKIKLLSHKEFQYWYEPTLFNKGKLIKPTKLI